MPPLKFPTYRQYAAACSLLAMGLIGLAHPHVVNAQVALPTTVPSTRPSLTYTISAAENKHLEREAQVSLAMIDTAIDANPPATHINTARGLALVLFDAILHDPNAPERPSIGAFRRMRTQRAIDDMRQTKVTDNSVVIWQIYNMGFVVRTRSVTLGFDLVELSHVPVLAMDDQSMKAIVDQCDVLFVSHEHLDHADHKVAKFFLDAGKPVLGTDAMWKGEPIYDSLTHLPRDGDVQGHSLSVCHGRVTLNIVVYPGAQRLKDGTQVEDNVYVITTPEGFRIAQTGDNNTAKGVPSAKKPIAPVDLLITKFDPDWIRIQRVVSPFKPRLVLPAHFEELGHVNVNGREPYWRGMERAAKLDVPTVLMMWGERFDYVRPAS